jgi:hypothetical protein
VRKVKSLLSAVSRPSRIDDPTSIEISIRCPTERRSSLLPLVSTPGRAIHKKEKGHLLKEKGYLKKNKKKDTKTRKKKKDTKEKGHPLYFAHFTSQSKWVSFFMKCFFLK